MTTELAEPRQEKKTEKTYVLASIIMEPEDKVSGQGREYKKLVLATGNGLEKGSDVVWNAVVMKKLADKLPKALFKKGVYAKWAGQASHKPYFSKKHDKEVMAHDLIVSAVYLQDGTAVYQEDKKENADEDAPF